MFSDFLMTTDVMSAVLNLLPIFLIAYAASEGTKISGWKLRKMGRKRLRKARSDLFWFLGIVLGAVVVEMIFLFALNGGEVRGAYAISLWFCALTWLVSLSVAFVASNIPEPSAKSKGGHDPSS